MPGIFTVPGRPDLQNLSLDEILARANKGSGTLKDEVHEPYIFDTIKMLNTTRCRDSWVGLRNELTRINRDSQACIKMLHRFRDHALPHHFDIKGRDGEEVLRSDLADKAHFKICDFLDGMTPRDRTNLLRSVEREIIRDKVAKRREREKTESDISRLRTMETVVNDVLEWLKQGVKMERPQGSHLHKFMDAMAEGRAFYLMGTDGIGPKTVEKITALTTNASIFVVEHDWHAAFGSSAEYESGVEVKLPDDRCVFEFRFSGRSVIAMVYEDDRAKDSIGAATVMVSSKDGDHWLIDLDRETAPELTLRIDQLVASICIALDAEVADTEVVRAPHKLNHAREKRGRAPLYSYHVVNLARRSRAPRLERDTTEPPANRKRLHFRRGHWRHFDDHKTWVKWTLVGDPDLGWVEKEYRL